MLVLLLSILIALIDQVTKHLVMQSLLPGERIPVIPAFFQLRRIHNPGAAWGMFSGLGPWLIGVSIVMLALLVIYRRHILEDTLLHRISLSLMVAGIVGNLIDRIRLGHVVDFLDFYWGASHFPAFNVADMSICTGVGLYVLSQYLMGRRDRQSSAA